MLLHRAPLLLVTCLALAPVARVARAAEPAAPAEFPRFELPGHEKEARVLSEYLWYHFSHRGGMSPVMFNKEYLLTADAWLSAAVPRGRTQSTQEVLRSCLLAAEIDPEGYVLTHQHFSHCHDHGWPFPMWTQADRSRDGVRGKTIGWHFQETSKVPGWTGDSLRAWRVEDLTGAEAAAAWRLARVESLGVNGGRWRLRATGLSPTITTPEGIEIDTFQSPYLQLRWKRSGTPPRHQAPWIEWRRRGDAGFTRARRMRFFPDRTPLSGGIWHSMVPVHRHPEWTGKITEIRISLAPGESDVELEIDSFFTHYDTRHTINNPILILASWRYFTWTGDLAFLREQMPRLRIALRHQQTVMGGLEHRHIRVPWPGHDGIAGWVRRGDDREIRGGHGIGNNYWDILPFGWDDLYATSQYHAATLRMADLEEAIRDHPGWALPRGALAFDPDELRAHAAEVKERANQLFWSEDTGRFVASIDAEGRAHDFGFTFVNLDAIWYGIASDQHARSILDWITGERVVTGDTSTGKDIYRWRFGPRATTRRNVEWYGQGWYHPESLPWGGQVQDGGAVLGFSFYDLWARLRHRGPDDAWGRLAEILAWNDEVMRSGGYRAYYADGKRGTTLQGGGTAGGLGIDHEFYESSLLPSIVVYGFLGLEPLPAELRIDPRLPAACPEMAVRNLLYRGVRLDLRARRDRIELLLHDEPVEAIRLLLEGDWRLEGGERSGRRFVLETAGRHVLRR